MELNIHKVVPSSPGRERAFTGCFAIQEEGVEDSQRSASRR
jgi:hypothetical protein